MAPLLNGIRVLDLTQMLPGPYGTLVLADLGAEVIKVEHPDGGDGNRHREPTDDGESWAHRLRNRNKRSIALDLKADRGRDVFLNLAATADVVVEAFRPGTADRLGIGYDAVRAANEDIVYCSLTGYGQDGPYADRPGHDLNYVGVAGLLSLTGVGENGPVPPGYPVSDFAGGLSLAFAVTAALVGVANGHGGDHVDVSMTDAVASFALTHAHQLFGGDAVPVRGETMFTGAHPAYQVFEAADGKYLTVSAPEAQFWTNLCEAIDRPDLKDRHVGLGTDPEADGEDLLAELRGAIAARPRDEWLERFTAFDVPAGPVNKFEEVFLDAHMQGRAVFERPAEADDLADGAGGPASPDGSTDPAAIRVPLEFDGDRTVPLEPAPALGADSAALLRDLGYDADEVATFSAAGILRMPD
jgi:crotonobetainyl-CoA:carnitine CoA-transferase CaiB-like acyl-CoA transferase